MRSLAARIRFHLDHRWAPDQMSDYLDGELAPGLRARMERHLSECVECRHLITGLTRVVGALRVLPGPEGVRDPGQLAGAVRLRLREPAP